MGLLKRIIKAFESPTDTFHCYHCGKKYPGRHCHQCTDKNPKGTYYDKHGYPCKPTIRIPTPMISPGRSCKIAFTTNFNYYVKVKVTEYGEQILRSQREEINLELIEGGGSPFGPYELKVDDDGYTTFQIWDLMKRFGNHFELGKPEPIKGDMIFLDAQLFEKG
ncbi:hypothetical protein KIH86_03585 [Paenibacillus sp. HN-1]|uniref:hypothetical protein n=1 Tax=Paenibacillus TaxID=44249 RepID=UPI001CA971A2|nr:MULTISPECIES: hypothetical protein [Paenibacillus]MBY9077264.1 hypothetical protein [Paenibacillus sp. CGMCC 1.18879]MBY9083311.1 hypothetical protein [Paenibacillus sinensis]